MVFGLLNLVIVCFFFFPCMSSSLDYADIKDTKVLLKTLGIRTMIMITAHMY